MWIKKDFYGNILHEVKTFEEALQIEFEKNYDDNASFEDWLFYKLQEVPVDEYFYKDVLKVLTELNTESHSNIKKYYEDDCYDWAGDTVCNEWEEVEPCE